MVAPKLSPRRTFLGFLADLSKGNTYLDFLADDLSHPGSKPSYKSPDIKYGLPQRSDVDDKVSIANKRPTKSIDQHYRHAPMDMLYGPVSAKQKPNGTEENVVSRSSDASPTTTNRSA